MRGSSFRVRAGRKDPYKYLFKVRNVGFTFRDMNEAVMREVVGHRSVNEVLTIGRQEIADEAKTHLQAMCDQYDTGITVDQIVLQDVNPPDPIKPSFNEINQAQQEREKLINEARAEYNRIIPRARGEAQQTIQQAEGYATDRVNRAKGAGESARIAGEKERQLKAITSEAYRQAQEIKGQADAEAADVYASAYNKDPEFYQFLRTMEIYRETLDENTLLLLTTGGDFLRYVGQAK